MPESLYLVPDYYPGFMCKMGRCRKACCEGWPISVTMKDYFTLLGIDCSADLRRRLDCALHLAEHPTQESYAHILPRYDGQCPLRAADGRCALHAEAGEDALADVCRLYPRGVRSGADKECSCANSCEAVLELLLDRQEPLSFISLPCDFRVPQAPPRRFRFGEEGRAQELRLWLIRLMQDREYPLPRRLQRMGFGLRALEEALGQSDHGRVDRLLSGGEPLPEPEDTASGRDALLFALGAANHLLEILDERSESIRAYGEETLRYLGSGEGEYSRYVRAREHFCQVLPQWESWFEHMLVNHMFFVQFPFQDRPVTLWEEFLALCAVYVLLRFLCIGWMARRGDAEDLVDAAAAAFRLVEHTEFDRYAAPVLEHLGCGAWPQMRQLLSL